MLLVQGFGSLEILLNISSIVSHEQILTYINISKHMEICVLSCLYCI